MTVACPAPTALLTASERIWLARPTVRGKGTFMNRSSSSRCSKLRSPKSCTAFSGQKEKREKYAWNLGTFCAAISESLSYFKNKYSLLYTTSDQAHVLHPPLLTGIQRTVIRACFLWDCLPLHFPPNPFTHNAPLRLQITECIWKQGSYKPSPIHWKRNEINSKVTDQALECVDVCVVCWGLRLMKPVDLKLSRVTWVRMPVLYNLSDQDWHTPLTPPRSFHLWQE